MTVTVTLRQQRQVFSRPLATPLSCLRIWKRKLRWKSEFFDPEAFLSFNLKFPAVKSGAGSIQQKIDSDGVSHRRGGGGWRLRLPIPPRENSLISLGEETVSQGNNHSWVIGFRSSVSTSKKLNNNQSNRRSAVQWYFPLQCKWVFSSPLVPGYWIKSHQGSWYPEETHF